MDYNPYKEDDMRLWREWRKTNNNDTLRQLMQRMQSLIHREVHKWQGTVPVPALESKARMLVLDALSSYDESKGAALSTHIVNRLQKLSRSVYPYQQIARLPENVQLKYNTVQVATNSLYDKLGRDPTTEELSDELSWPVKQVANFTKAYARKEFVESEDVGGTPDKEDDGLLDFYYHGLSTEDKLLFEDITGYNGKVPMNNSQVTKKYSITQNQLSYKKRQFVRQLLNLQSGGF